MLINLSIDVTPSQFAAIHAILQGETSPQVRPTLPLPLDEAPAPTPVMTSEAAPNPAVTQAAPEPAPEPAAPTKTIEDLRQLVLQIAAPKRIALVQELLNKVGVPKLSEIPEAQLDFAHDFLQKFFD